MGSFWGSDVRCVDLVLEEKAIIVPNAARWSLLNANPYTVTLAEHLIRKQIPYPYCQYTNQWELSKNLFDGHAASRLFFCLQGIAHNKMNEYDKNAEKFLIEMSHVCIMGIQIKIVVETYV